MNPLQRLWRWITGSTDCPDCTHPLSMHNERGCHAAIVVPGPGNFTHSIVDPSPSNPHGIPADRQPRLARCSCAATIKRRIMFAEDCLG